MEKNTDKKIDKVFNFMMVRDGNTVSAKMNGIDFNIKYLECEVLNEDEVINYFLNKKEYLLHAIEHEEMPQPCSDRETWNGRRCTAYCEVRHLCDNGGE